MSEKFDFQQARESMMLLTYPPATIRVPVSRAIGHRLAKPVTVKGDQPSRPVSMLDGLATQLRDVRIRKGDMPEQPDTEELESDYDYADDAADEMENDEESGGSGLMSNAFVNVESDGSMRDDEDEDMEVDDSALLEMPEEDQADYDAEDEPDAESDEGDDGMPSGASVELTLRRFPRSNRREDALKRGQAVPVQVGAEVPRGADYIYPLEGLFEPPTDAPEVNVVEMNLGDGEEGEEQEEKPKRRGRGRRGQEEESSTVRIMEVERSWDLLERLEPGPMPVPQVGRPGEPGMIEIGSWARNKDTVVPERSILRGSEISLLKTLGIKDVMVYRRPVVGVATLGNPFPIAGHNYRAQEHRVCPLLNTATELVRAADVAALPLGFAPDNYHELVQQADKWAQQVDIMMIVGGSHHGPRCLGHDLLATRGDVMASGLNMKPARNLSVGKLGKTPLFVVPGSLPDVLVATIMFVRPLAHKYLRPRQYQESIELTLERGSQMSVDRDTVVPVRFGFNQQLGTYSTRFRGKLRDQWLDYIRGQALVPLEGGRQYEDGDVVTAYLY